MMTLDEAIPHCEEVAEELDRLATRDEDASGYTRSHIESLKTDQSIKCRECASDHRQLAGWLRELKAYRDTYKNYSKVEKMLICEVEKAKENPCVKKPIAYGLYQTWKFWDKNEVEREVNADE